MSLGHLVQGRLGDIDVPFADKLGHLAEEEREQERADVAPVHVGVGHDDDLAVTKLAEVELVPMPTRRAAINVRISSKPRILSMRAFSTLRGPLERQNRLRLHAPALRRNMPPPVSFDDENLASSTLPYVLQSRSLWGMLPLSSAVLRRVSSRLHARLACLRRHDALQAKPQPPADALPSSFRALAHRL